METAIAYWRKKRGTNNKSNDTIVNLSGKVSLRLPWKKVIALDTRISWKFWNFRRVLISTSETLRQERINMRKLKNK